MGAQHLMNTTWGTWLDHAETVLTDERSSEDAIEAVVASGLRLPDAIGADPAQIERVLACLSARRAALATELGDIARRRTDLYRARAAATGYLNAPLSVPME
jgi:hypothetical protein